MAQVDRITNKLIIWIIQGLHRQTHCNGPTPQFLSQGLYTQLQSPGTPKDHYPAGLKHTVPAHKAWVPPAVPPPPASTQAASLQPWSLLPLLQQGKRPTSPPHPATIQTGAALPKPAPSPIAPPLRTIAECEELIGKLDAAVIQLTSDKVEAESARVAAIMDWDAMQQALAANQVVLKATQASVAAMSISNKATEARMATMERMMAQFVAQSGMVGSGHPSGDQMIHDKENPMFTPRRSNEHKATIAVGPEGRQALSPSTEPPNKMSKPAKQLTDGDSNMLGTDQAGSQQNIHHNGGGQIPPRDQSPQVPTGQPGTSGDEDAEKC